jgi:hypothetical protein
MMGAEHDLIPIVTPGRGFACAIGRGVASRILDFTRFVVDEIELGEIR